jgi:hypothetical protein
MTTTFATLDSRKRLNLASFARSEVYILTAEPNGRIVLEPASVVSDIDRAIEASPAIMAALTRDNEGSGTYIDE